MKKEFYKTLLTLVVICSGLALRAQDSTSCNAHFYYYTSAGTAVSFRAADSLPNMQHSWTYGDGTGTGFSAHDQFVTHVYPGYGTFAVTHIIRDTTGTGCSDSVTQYVTITDPATNCYVYIGQTSDSSDEVRRYTFFPNVGGGPADSVTWYVDSVFAGHGDTLRDQTFDVGTHTICVTVHTTAGCTASGCSYVFIQKKCPIAPYIQTAADTAHPHIIHFTADPMLPGYSYEWDFGDGNAAAGASVTHEYGYGGNYTVYLYVFGHDGTDTCQTMAAGSVYVGEDSGCHVNFGYFRDSTYPGRIYLNAQTPRWNDSLTWVITRPSDSLNPVVLYGQNQTYTFTDTGCYRIVLLTVTTAGCHGQTEQWVCIDSLTTGNSFVSAYPNPSPGQTNVDLRMERTDMIYIAIYNSMGHQMLVKRQSGIAGMNHIILPTAGLPKGIYYVTLTYGGKTKRSKIQKL